MRDRADLRPALRAGDLQAPALGGGDDRAEIAGRAVPELEQHRRGVVQPVVEGESVALREDRVDVAGEVEHRVDDMDAASGHSPGRALLGLLAPVLLREAIHAPAVEVALDVQEPPY